MVRVIHHTRTRPGIAGAPGVVIGDTPPADTSVLWVDTSSGPGAQAATLADIDAAVAALEADIAALPDFSALPEITVDVTADDATDNYDMIANALADAATLVSGRYGRIVRINAIGSARTRAGITTPAGVLLAGRGSQATSLKPTAGFTDPYLIRMGEGLSQFEHAIGVADLRLYVDNRAAITDAIYTNTANEPSWLQRVRIEDYTGRAFHAERTTSGGTFQPSHIRISDCEFMGSVAAPKVGTDESVLLDTVGNIVLIERTTVNCMGDAQTAGTRRTTAIRADDTFVRIDSVHTEQHARSVHVTQGSLYWNGMASITGLTGHPSVDDVVYIDDNAPHALLMVSPHGATRTLTNTITGEAIANVITAYAYPAPQGPRRARAVRTITGTVTLGEMDEIILADTSGAAYSITLPTGVSVVGYDYVVKRVGANQLTLNPVGAATIDGVDNKRIDSDFGWVQLVYDGTEYKVIGQGGTITDIP